MLHEVLDAWDGEGGREAQEGRGIFIHVADLACVQQKLTQDYKAVIFHKRRQDQRSLVFT